MNVINLEYTLAKPLWAQNAQKRMKQLGITQLELSELIGLKTVGAIGHWFNGRRSPSLKNIELLAEHLKLPIADLFRVADEDSVLQGDARHLNDAMMLLCRSVSVPPSDAKIFFNVFESLGANNIIRAVNTLSHAEQNNISHTAAVVDIFDFMDETG